MQEIKQTSQTINTLDDLAHLADYSLMETLNSDPDAKVNGVDHYPREVFSTSAPTLSAKAAPAAQLYSSIIFSDLASSVLSSQ